MRTWLTMLIVLLFTVSSFAADVRVGTSWSENSREVQDNGVDLGFLLSTPIDGLKCGLQLEGLWVEEKNADPGLGFVLLWNPIQALYWRASELFWFG